MSCLQGQEWECRERGNCDEQSDALSVSEHGSSRIDLFRSIVGADSPDQAAEPVNSSSAPSIGPSEEDEELEFELRTYKDDSALKDQQSTGRKRAAKMYPLDPEKSCEWSMMKNCGGGKHPIVGCADGIQAARHHGPEKNTLNNEKGNVHRICHTCHNRWHTLNDEGYVWDAIQEPHNPQPATFVDIAKSEQYWTGKTVVKAKD